MTIVENLGNKKKKEEYKSHSQIIINFFFVFGFITRFWPMHENVLPKIGACLLFTCFPL